MLCLTWVVIIAPIPSHPGGAFRGDFLYALHSVLQPPELNSRHDLACQAEMKNPSLPLPRYLMRTDSGVGWGWGLGITTIPIPNRVFVSPGMTRHHLDSSTWESIASTLPTVPTVCKCSASLAGPSANPPFPKRNWDPKLYVNNFSGIFLLRSRMYDFDSLPEF